MDDISNPQTFSRLAHPNLCSFRSAIAPDGPPTISGVNSLYDMFMSSVEKYPDNKCLGRRSGDAYTWLTYKQTADAAAAIGSAMAHVGVGPHGRAGVYGANCPEWMISMQACNRMSVYCIPLYDSLGENAIEFIINHSESSLVFVQASNLPELIKALPKVKNLVKNVVYWGGDASSAAASVGAIKDLGLGVFSFEDFTKLGQDNMKDAVPSKATDLCTIMYTSGTTGDPKVSALVVEAVKVC
jgi:long-chain acyl-CoA synthetase